MMKYREMTAIPAQNLFFLGANKRFGVSPMSGSLDKKLFKSPEIMFGYCNCVRIQLCVETGLLIVNVRSLDESKISRMGMNRKVLMQRKVPNAQMKT